MNRRLVCAYLGAVLALALLGACQANLSSAAPAVTASFLRAGARQGADSQTLTEGRRVYVNRCIQCHALPHVSKYDAPRLKAILAIMSRRASLTAEQHEAVLKYLLTVRSQ
jgi:mono/diheme cytochrome c family protein